MAIITYKIENEDLVEAFNIKINSQNGATNSFDKLYYSRGLITFGNDKIIILCSDEIYVFQLIKIKWIKFYLLTYCVHLEFGIINIRDIFYIWCSFISIKFKLVLLYLLCWLNV